MDYKEKEDIYNVFLSGHACYKNIKQKDAHLMILFFFRDSLLILHCVREYNTKAVGQRIRSTIISIMEYCYPEYCETHTVWTSEMFGFQKHFSDYNE